MASREAELSRLLVARHHWEQEAAFARTAIRQLNKEIQALEDADEDGTVIEPPMPVAVAHVPQKRSRTARSRSRRPAQELSQLDDGRKSQALSGPPGVARGGE